jgi:hypothetical protein
VDYIENRRRRRACDVGRSEGIAPKTASSSACMAAALSAVQCTRIEALWPPRQDRIPCLKNRPYSDSWLPTRRRFERLARAGWRNIAITLTTPDRSSVGKSSTTTEAGIASGLPVTQDRTRWDESAMFVCARDSLGHFDTAT